MGSGLSATNYSLKWKQFHILHNEVIGNGGFAVMKRGIYLPKKKEVAIKIINIDMCLNRTNGLEMLRTEFEALKILTTAQSQTSSSTANSAFLSTNTSNHLISSSSSSHNNSQQNPFISLLHYAYCDFTNCYLIFDQFTGGDLRYYLTTRQCFRENQIAFIIACISCALEFIHSKGILHRDIKPDNIIFTSSGYPKLIDFGVSCICEDSSLSCSYASGTLSYLAPEILTSSHVHGKGSDYWSLGIVMYEILYLCKPWKTHCPKDYVKYIESYYAGEEEMKKSTRRLNSVTYLDRESRDSADEVHSYRSYQPSQSTHSHHSLSTDMYSSMQYIPSDYEMPSSLTVPLNEYTAYGQYISTECLNLLSGLLDIRLDKRLGSSLTGISQFMKHPWWKLTQIPLDRMMSCGKEDDLEALLKSPIRIDVNTVQETIKWTNAMNMTLTRKPDGFHESSNSSSPRNASGGVLDGFTNFSRRIFRRSPPSSPSNKSNQILPLNFSNEVVAVLDNYHYSGSTLT